MIRLRMRTRLTIWFAASVLLILSPFLAGILAMQWQSMRAALDHHLEEDLEVGAEMLELRGGEITWRTNAEHDPGYDAGIQRWVEVYTADGQPAYLRGLPRQDGVRRALPAPSPATSGHRTIQTPAGAWVRTLSIERSFGGRPMWIRVARTEDGLRQDLRALVLLFSLAAPLAVLAAAVAGYVISGRMLAPLGRMADRARSISAEHLSERLPIGNPADEMGQLALVFNDTFARLEASFEQLRRFTADVSHELRTPLTAIRSVGEVGLREARDARAYQEVIGSMLEEVGRLAGVVDTLLTLSRWERGRVRPNPQDVDLHMLARDVAGQLGVLAEERGVALDLALNGPLVVAADPIMIRQALINVLDNSIKFTPEGGSIRMSSTSSPREHQLIVDDEGPGIPIAERERVLERFYKTQGGEHTRGAGLGLAIVHWALTANGGRITIGDSPAGGARVTLALPRRA